jgi:NADH-quinone oxidoreductase subunit G
VLANLLDLPGFDFESSQDVLKQVAGADAAQLPADRLGNGTQAAVDLSVAPAQAPAVASIYQLDGLVRRATSLQLTADARQAAGLEAKLEGVAA